LSESVNMKSIFYDFWGSRSHPRRQWGPCLADVSRMRRRRGRPPPFFFVALPLPLAVVEVARALAALAAPPPGRPYPLLLLSNPSLGE
jgi:hypothetical protein